MKLTTDYLKTILEIFSSQHNFSRITKAIRSGHTELSISGLKGSAISLFSGSLYKEFKKPVLIVVNNSNEAEDIRDDMESLLGSSNVCFLPGRETKPTLFSEFDSTYTYFINDTINKMTNSSNPVIISTLNGLFTVFPDKSSYESNLLVLEVGKDFSRDLFIEKLISFHYNQVDVVEYPFDFAVKGCVIDFFPPVSRNPYRIEFFDNKLESIRTFNTEDQLSISRVEKCALYPNPNFPTDPKKVATLFSYLDKNAFIILAQHDHSVQLPDDIVQKLAPDSSYKILQINDSPKSDFSFNIHYPSFSHGNVSIFKEHLATIHTDLPNPKIVVLSSNLNQTNRLKVILESYPVIISEGVLSHSLEISSIGLFVYVEHELFARERQANVFKNLPSNFESQKIDPDKISTGDFMVHLNYGIGRYIGLVKIEAFGSVRECLVLEYAGGDKVFVPLEKLKNVQKYKTSDTVIPKINHLGTKEWDRVKTLTKRSLENVSCDIIRLYASRLRSKGFAFQPDTEMQIEMESEFMYEETPDQFTATDEIKWNMETARPMDRLLCGDVGFGKTEVAIRAAFKAVTNSKQVAVLVPTTILADQHFHTFSRRLQNFPVNIAMLSRFVDRKAIRQILQDIAHGAVDIVIGTHRLLSDDVHFKDLGLLIIDEEHRFGVKHKDKIKTFRNNIDILLLSATPIPRSLHFSLIGARDFSQINTPPKSRLPIFTDIISFDEEIIKMAVYREIGRGGQIYFVHNEVKSIALMTNKLRALFPDLSIQFAHGQMSEKDLEPIMNSFIKQGIDILVTSAIIESGIDIPNVNTIFINRAQNFGLAQLYQLRGRVGRSNRRAYAYLIVPNQNALTQDAIKRLQTIKRYTSLGSGYSIALKDLEIRGAGNVFGVEQSGNINAVGYHMYMNILKDALEKAKSAEIGIEESHRAVHQDVEIVYPYPSYFPEDYISSPSIRLEYYRRLSEVESCSELLKIKSEVRDIFGVVPEYGENLLGLTRIRVLASVLGIRNIVFKDSIVQMSFVNKNPFNSNSHLIESIGTAARSSGFFYKFLPDEDLQLLLFIRRPNPVLAVKHFLDVLQGTVNL